MNLLRRTVKTPSSFTPKDVSANQRGTYSEEQRGLVALLHRITRAQRRPYTPTFATRSTTQAMPQIHIASGHIHTISATSYVQPDAIRAGYRIESFFLIVHTDERDIEFQINPDEVESYDPRCNYTVYYYLNRNVPMLLSAHISEEEVK